MNKFGIQGFTSAEAAKSDSEINFPHGDVVILKHKGIIGIDYAWVAPSLYAEELIKDNPSITVVPEYLQPGYVLECDRPGFKTVGDKLVDAGVLIS